MGIGTIGPVVELWVVQNAGNGLLYVCTKLLLLLAVSGLVLETSAVGFWLFVE